MRGENYRGLDSGVGWGEGGTGSFEYNTVKGTYPRLFTPADNFASFLNILFTFCIQVVC